MRKQHQRLYDNMRVSFSQFLQIKIDADTHINVAPSTHHGRRTLKMSGKERWKWAETVAREKCHIIARCRLKSDSVELSLAKLSFLVIKMA